MYTGSIGKYGAQHTTRVKTVQFSSATTSSQGKEQPF